MFNETTRLVLQLSSGTNTFSGMRNGTTADELHSTALAINSVQADTNLQQVRRLYRYELGA